MTMYNIAIRGIGFFCVCVTSHKKNHSARLHTIPCAYYYCYLYIYNRDILLYIYILRMQHIR